MKALIFGASGQDGYYLSEICTENNIEPVGIARSGFGMKGDVSDYSLVESLVRDLKPAYIFHVAANSTTRHEPLFENHATISTGTLNILESVYKHKTGSRVFITGSGVQFVNDGTPITENTPFEASSPYSIARIQSVYAARYYRTLGLKAYVGYLFHHESPLRKPNHMSKKVISAAKSIKQGKTEIFEVGDISVEKEWAFAGDIAAGIFTLVNQDNVFEAVIGTGKTHTIKEWIELCFGRLGLDWKEKVKVMEGFTPEYKRLVSNPETIFKIGWKPKVSFEQLAEMMINADV
jgi:GDPmannose 4,6-dehydratase